MENRISESKDFVISSNIKRAAAVGGLVGGMFLMLLGIILSAIAYFEHVNFHRAEVILLVASFIALAIGSHCLDLLEKEKKAKKIEFIRKYKLPVK